MGLYLEHMLTIRGLLASIAGIIVGMNLKLEEVDTSSWVKFAMVVVEASFLCQSANKDRVAGDLSNLMIPFNLYRTDHLGLIREEIC